MLAYCFLLLGLACINAFQTPLADMREMSSVNGLLDIVLVAVEIEGPVDLTISGQAPPKLWVYEACARTSADQLDCDGVVQTNLFYGLRLNVLPGDNLKVRLVNRLPATLSMGPTRTNLHFHGQLLNTHSNGGTFGDYVFVECYNSLVETDARRIASFMDFVHTQKDFIDYDLKYPSAHPEGLYWFHPHNHMSGVLNQGQINAGMSGVVVVGALNPVPGADVEHLLLRTTFIRPNGSMLTEADPLFCTNVPVAEAYLGYCPGIKNVTDFRGGKVFFTINGQVYPELQVPPTGGQVWRITQSIASITLELTLVNDLDGTLIPFQVVASDGVAVEHSSNSAGVLAAGTCETPGVLCADIAFMMPSTRMDIFLASSNVSRTATLVGRGPLMGSGGDYWPSVKLGTVVFAAGTLTTAVEQLAQNYMPVLNDTTQIQLACSHPLPAGHHRRIFFGVPEDADFGLQYEEVTPSGKRVRGTRTEMSAFDPNEIVICAQLGTSELWEIVNISEEDHNFHIHQAKFRVINQTSQIKPWDNFVGNTNLVDTVPIAPNTSTFIEIPFYISGDFMYHCHIAEHSNNGMMARIRVTTNIVAESLFNTAIIAIVARELVEMSILVLSHVGTVLRSPLRRERKIYYARGLGLSFAAALLIGMIVSVSVGFGIAAAVENSDTVDNGMMIGEGVSKVIAAYFVCSVTLKIPRWFGISNYVKPGEKEKQEAITKGADLDDLGVKRGELSLSLFWNAVRETIECGVLTALTYLFSTAGLDTLGASVGVGIAVCVFVSVTFGLGGVYLSAKAFGIAATGLTILLSLGLVTGAVHEWEELFTVDNGYSSPVVFSIDEDTAEGSALGTLEAVGLASEMTQLTMSTLFITLFVLIVLNVWHNYYGKEVYNFTYCFKKAAKLLCPKPRAFFAEWCPKLARLCPKPTSNNKEDNDKVDDDKMGEITNAKV
ncbi:hypothetical protein BASA81_007579 [Batrachochytrium salamandrivorans]|nr:hypothetical protein BASA81_007579 [Batrachochytrium salamandrivorans]